MDREVWGDWIGESQDWSQRSSRKSQGWFEERRTLPANNSVARKDWKTKDLGLPRNYEEETQGKVNNSYLKDRQKLKVA